VARLVAAFGSSHSPMLASRVEGAHLVQVIGRTVVLYRAHPEKPTIKL